MIPPMNPHSAHAAYVLFMDDLRPVLKTFPRPGPGSINRRPHDIRNMCTAAMIRYPSGRSLTSDHKQSSNSTRLISVKRTWSHRSSDREMVSHPVVHSVRKPQFPLDCLEARLLAQRVEELMAHPDQVWIAVAHRRFKPIKCTGGVPPLCVDHRVKHRRGVA